MADLNKIKAVVDNIEKSWGKGAIMRIDDNRVIDVDVISSGSLSLDAALGTFGYAKGRIIELYGWQSAGKSTLAIHAIAETQKEGLAAAYIDAENAFDKYYAQNLGVIIEGDNALYISQPDHGEMALDILEKLVSSQQFSIIVVDSVAALVPKAELEGEMGDAAMGLQARLMSKAMRKLSGSIRQSNCIVIFINQLREKIGLTFGSPTNTTGGNALKFYASVRLEVTAIGQLKDGENTYGMRTRVKVVKNKLAVPFKKAEFDIVLGKGISKFGEIIDFATEYGFIQKSGSWYSYGDTRLGQGRENIIKLFADNPELCDELELKIKDKLLGGEIEQD